MQRAHKLLAAASVVVTAVATPAFGFSCEEASGNMDTMETLHEQMYTPAQRDGSSELAELWAHSETAQKSDRHVDESTLRTNISASQHSNSSCPPEPHFSSLMKAININYPGLEAVKAARAAGDNEAVCIALADYYQKGQSASWLRADRNPASSNRKAGGVADAALRDHYSFYGTSADVPRYSSGGLNWSFCPAPQHDAQWMLALQRHGVFLSLAQAWNSTGNSLYARKLNDLVRDWITYAGEAPLHVNNTYRCNGPPDWLTLDSGLRISGPWPRAFFLAQRAADFVAASRLLMVSSTAEHAAYLSLKGSQSNTANWEATQCHGLITTGLSFPELIGSMEWLRQGSSCTEQLMSTGVYPDGVSTEQTAGYDQVALRSYDGILMLFESAGVAPPSALRSGVERMYTYLAYQMSADGLQVLNGDSDLDSLVSSVSAAAVRFDRDDWIYLATRGMHGVPPSLYSNGCNGSSMFPWAGQLIMQSRWGATRDEEKLWAWLDVGPFGSSCHSHRDKLHLSVRAYGEHLLVDSGRFGYQGSLAKFRERYGSLTQAHNTLQLDNAEQVGILGAAHAPIANDSWSIAPESDFAFAEVEFERLEGLAVHTRGVRHLRHHGVLVVVDRVATDRARNVTTLWHAHPNCSISLMQNPTRVHVKGRNASLMLTSAVGSTEWQSMEHVAGVGNVATGAGLQGWYSHKYDTKSPAPVAIARTRTNSNATFVWVIATSQSALPPRVQGSVVGNNNGGSVDVEVTVDGHALGVVSVPVSANDA